MSIGIAGLGWVTPLGTGLDEVWAQVRAGVVPEVKTLTNPETGRVHSVIVTPPSAVAHLSRNPRLRRASAISHLAVAAGLAALENAGEKIARERTAVVFAICDGGVLYTRKFYEQIARQGANTASPLLFPETVYNAPASHLAALLGIDGASYTLVGDGSVGMSALHFAAELLETSDVEQVVVVGAEECDWILCEAYAAWRLARTPLAEGAAALVLRREGHWRLHTHPGAPFFHRRDAGAALSRVVAATMRHRQRERHLHRPRRSRRPRRPFPKRPDPPAEKILRRMSRRRRTHANHCRRPERRSHARDRRGIQSPVRRGDGFRVTPRSHFAAFNNNTGIPTACRTLSAVLP